MLERSAVALAFSENVPVVLHQSQLKNRILSDLSEPDFQLLAGALSFRDCPHAEVLNHPGETILNMIFPETCIISVVAQSPGGQSAEGGLIGREGFSSTAVLLGADQTPLRVEVQVAGHGHTMLVSNLHVATSKSETLRSTLLKFVHVLNVQATYTVMTNALHQVEERLARWLLMCRDRSDSDDIALTHKFMTVMLGVRRASVTDSLLTLQRRGFIQSKRGYVTLMKRKALEEYAGDAYGGPEAEYLRLFGPLAKTGQQVRATVIS